MNDHHSTSFSRPTSLSAASGQRAPEKGPKAASGLRASNSNKMRSKQENSNYKRKKRKAAPIDAFGLLWALLLLICDISNWSTPHQAAAQQQQQAAAAAAAAPAATPAEYPAAPSGEQHRGASLVAGPARLVAEPGDQRVLAGQRATLTCLVANRNSSLEWGRLGLDGATIDGISTEDSVEPFYGSNYAVAISSQQLANGDQLTNCSLVLRAAALQDEGQYQCRSQQPIRSRLARLEVLRAPSKLALTVHSSAPTDEGLLEEQLWPAPQAAPATHKQQQQQTPTSASEEPLERLTVRQNARLRLECRSDQAKPRAELVWLDEQQRAVPKRAALEAADNASWPNAADSFVEELAQVQENGLSGSALVWSLKVEKQHANQVISCVANHAAFEDERNFAQLFGRQLRRRLQLEVQYAPEIELLKDQLHAYEHKPIRFTCAAQGHPNELSYAWFIDEQQVENATSAELRIERLTRQMHLREIKCQVSNVVGSSSAVLRLAVRYAPAYVTQQLPASLQPAGFELAAEQRHQQAARRPLAPAPQSGLGVARTPIAMPRAREFALARQLAHGFEENENVELRCDFDANPRVHEVAWFKVQMSYGEEQDVEPRRADELIAFGVLRAVLRDEPRLSQATKRHIVASSVAEQQISAAAELVFAGDDVGEPEELEAGVWPRPDYELMSRELLAELEELEAHQAAPRLAASDGAAQSAAPARRLELLARQTPTQSNVRISEPLDWFMEAPAAAAAAANQTASKRAPHLRLVEPLTRSQLGRRSQRARLQQRDIQLSSAQLPVARANVDAVAKYVCRARSSAQPLGQQQQQSAGQAEQLSARAVFLVERRRPRIISAREQFAPLGSTRLQVECLVQIHTVVDNATFITWTKEGKLIEAEQQQEPHGKTISVLEERSPDLVYMRSVLRVDGADHNDFGRYNCSVVNSKGQDHWVIELQPTAPTGFVFAIMASLTIGTVLILVCVFILLILFTPRRKLDSKQAVSMQNSHHNNNNNNSNKLSLMDANSTAANGEAASQSGASNSSTVEQRSPRTTDAAGLHPLGAGSEANCDTGAGQLLYSLGAPRSLDDDQRHLTARSQDHADGANNFANHNNRLRSSLREAAFYNNQQQKSNRFAAIHESLEHKLHLGQPPFLRAPPGGANSQQSDDEAVKQAAFSSELEAANSEGSGSLINRLWVRLMQRPADDSTTRSNRRVKSRPVISMPINGVHKQSGGGRRRSSLSTSLSVLSAPTHSSSIASDGSGRKRDAHQLVSSSVNLIQDSTTASDGSGSAGEASSRSSSSNGQPQVTSGNNLETSNQMGSYSLPVQQHAPMWMQQQQQQQVQSSSLGHYHQQNLDGGLIKPRNLYANQYGSPANFQSPEQAQHLYTNNFVPAPDHHSSPAYLTSLNPLTGQLTTAGYTNQTIGWSDHQNQSVPVAHYQLPMQYNAGVPQIEDQCIMNSPSEATTFFNGHSSDLPAQNGQNRPCYATVCTVTPTNQQRQYSLVSTTYGSLPMRSPSVPPQQQQAQQMIATSDAGDAFFESNYGTLISRSSAYKTLGYAHPESPGGGQLSQLHNVQLNSVAGSLSTASSSPNSMTTHHNVTASNLNLESIQQNLAAKQSKPAHQAEAGESCQETVTVLKTKNTNSSGSVARTVTTTSAAKNDNGQATHV